MKRMFFPSLLLVLLLLSSCAATISPSLYDDPVALGKLPGFSSAQEIALGIFYIPYAGEVLPPFHLLIVDTRRGAALRPLPVEERGMDGVEALRLGAGVAAVNGSPFRWSCIPYLSRRLPAVSWFLGGRDSFSAPSPWGSLVYRDGSYRIYSAEESPDPGLLSSGDWLAGGYLPILRSGENIGIAGELHARTAVGIGNGLLYILVVEGESFRRPGLNSRDTAAILAHYGAEDAINFDGGDASALYLHDPPRPVYRGRRRKLPCWFILRSAPTRE